MKRIRRILATAMSFMMCLTLLSNTAFAQGVTPLIDSSDDVVYVNDIEDEDFVDGVESSVDEDEIVSEDVIIEDEQDENILDESEVEDEITLEEADADDASDDFDVDEEDVQDASDINNDSGFEETTEEEIDSDDYVDNDTISSDEEDESTPEEVSINSDDSADSIVISEDEELSGDSDTEITDDVETEIIEDEISEEIQETFISSSQEANYTFENDSLDSDFLLEEYIDREIDRKQTPMFNSSSFNGNKLTGINKTVYDKTKSAIAEIANGERESTAITFTKYELGCGGSYSAAELGVAAIVNEEGITDEAKDALMVKTGLSSFDYGLVSDALRSDCPYERYWMGLRVSVDYFKFYAYESDGVWKLSFDSDTYMTYGFEVSSDYKGANDFTVDLAKTKAVKAAIGSINNILDGAKTKNDLQKIEYYRDQICDLVEYNNEAATWPASQYGDPWQLIYVFDGDFSTNVVCEGYSKAFMYLCNKTFFSSSSINCYVVSGNMDSEPHMWNVIHWSDNNNYMIDVTNCDSLGTDNLFMASPVSGDVSSGYSFDAGSGNILYAYDDETKALYSEDELKIGSDIYGNLTDFFINYDTDIYSNEDIPFTLIKVGGSENCQYRLDWARNSYSASVPGIPSPEYGDDNVFTINFPKEDTYTITFSVKDTDDTEITKSITINVKTTRTIYNQQDLKEAFKFPSYDENIPSKITLMSDITVTDMLQTMGNVVLDLNGHVISRENNGLIFELHGTLTIMDSNPDATHDPEITYTSPIDDTKTYIINGGIIKGGKSSAGGAIKLTYGSKLVLNGGSIALNNSTGYGGAVYVASGTSFTMNDGFICGNSGYEGGGVAIDGGTFVMNGGSIAGNTSGYTGGGVFVTNSGTFVMNDGLVTENYITYGEGDGGGVYIRTSGDFKLNGGTISYNKSPQGAGLGMYDNATATMTGGKICNNTSTWNRGGAGGVNIYACQYFNMTGGEISNNEATNGNGGGIKLNTVTFNMSGDAVIKDNKAATEGGGIYVYYNKATISMSGNALIKDNEAGSNGGGIRNGTITMEDNAGIEGNVSNGWGGGIHSDYSVSMSDNAFVDNNISRGGRGGAGIVCGDVNLSDDASVSGNRFEAENYTSWGGAGGIYTEGTITMTGGHIDNNYSAADGGGIGMYYSGTLVISGGTITGNKAKRNSGAIQDNGDYGAHVEISGNPVIMNNTAGENDIVSNIRYGRDYYIHIVGPLTDGAQIGVTTKGTPSQSNPQKIVQGYSTYNTEDPSEFFVSDQDYLFYTDNDGNVRAVTPWQNLGIQLSKGGTVQLTEDIKAIPGDSAIGIDSNTTVTLDLNGHILDGCGIANYVFYFYRVENVDFTIIDSNPTAEHTPEVTYTDPVTQEIVTVNGGIITGATGRGIFNYGGTTITMKGGSLTGNNGGVYLINSIFNLEGGSICGNICSGDGGGVWPYYGGTFNMSGGSICGNTAAGEGGGVYLWENQSSHSSMYLSGGTVKNNVSVGTGGGIKVANRGHLYVSGNPQVYNNKRGDELNNIISVNYGVFNINGEITSGAKIEVTGVPSLGSWNKLTSGFSTYNPDSNPVDYFFPADEGAFISLYDGEATLYANNVITFDANGGTGEMSSLNNIGGLYTLPENSFTPARGKKFRKWKIGNREYAPGTQYNICDNTNIIAMWDNLPLYTITYNVNGGNDLDPATYTLYDGEEYGEMAVPNWPGYVFDGWFTSATAGDQILSTDICHGNITLYAHWSDGVDIPYRVEHYKQNINGTYPSTPFEVEKLAGEVLSTISPDVKEYEGFTSPEKKTVVLTEERNLVIRYEYTRNSYELTWDFDGGYASGSYTTGSVKYENYISRPNVKKNGYVFAGWDMEVPSYMPANDLTFKAKWKTNIWLGGIEISEENASNLTAAINEAAGTQVASGTAYYDGSSNTLYLDNFVYEGEGYSYADTVNDLYYSSSGKAALCVYNRTLKISVTGDNSLTQHSVDATGSGRSVGLIIANKSSLEISGEGATLQFIGDASDAPNWKNDGIIIDFSNNLTVYGVILKAFAKGNETQSSIGVYVTETGNLDLRNGSTLECYGYKYATYYADTDYLDGYSRGYLYRPGNAYFKAGSNPDGSNAVLAPAMAANMHDMVVYKYIKMDYADLFVGGVPVADDNAGDIIGSVNTYFSESGSGSATYDKNTKTLTLNNVNLTNKSTSASDTLLSAIYYYNTEPLTINVIGENSLTSKRSVDDMTAGIYCEQADLNIIGSGKLTIKGADQTNTYVESYGIFTHKTVIVDGPEVEVIGGYTKQDYSYGIGGNVYLKNGTLTATGGDIGYYDYDTYGIYGDVQVDNGTLNANGGNVNIRYYYSCSYGIYGKLVQNGGTVNACGGQCVYDGSEHSSVGIYNATVNDGILNVTTKDSTYYCYGIKDDLTVNGGTVNITTGNGAYCYGVDDAYINDGNVNISCGNSTGSQCGVSNQFQVKGGTVAVTPGTSGGTTRGGGYLTVYGGDVTINSGIGSGKCYGTSSLSVYSGNLKITAEDATNESIAVNGTAYINGGNVELISKGTGSVAKVVKNYMSFDNYRTAVAVASRYSDGSNPEEYSSENESYYKYIKTMNAYAIYIGDVLVNDANASDIFGDGKASFDPDTFTFHLNGVDLVSNYDKAVIHYPIEESGKFTVELSGNNTFTYKGTTANYIGIFSFGQVDLKFADNATLTVSAENAYNTISTVGVRANGLTVDGNGTLNVYGKTTKNYRSDTVGIHVAKEFVLSGGADVNVYGGDYEGTSGSSYESNSTAIKTYAGTNFVIGDGSTLNALAGTNTGGYNYGQKAGMFINMPCTITLKGNARINAKALSTNDTGDYINNSNYGIILNNDSYYTRDFAIISDSWTGRFEVEGSGCAYQTKYRSSYYPNVLKHNPAEVEILGYYYNDENEYCLDSSEYTGYIYYNQLVIHPNKAIITFDANKGSGSVADLMVDKGTTYTLPGANTFTAPKGYSFNKWQVTIGRESAVNMNPGDEVVVSKDTVVKAIWKARTDTAYKVEHYKQGLDGKYTAKPAVEKLKGTTGASIKPAVKKYEGFTSPSVQKVKIKADGTLVVKYYYTRNSYTLKWDLDGGSASGKYTSGKVKYGTKITAPTPTKKGYTFNGWSATVSKTMPAKNVTYKAKWKANAFTLTWDLAGGTASNKYTSGKVKAGAKITAPVPTKEGYTFDGWSVSVPSKMPAKNLKITAKWREKTQEEYVTEFVKRFYSVVLERPQAEIDADVDGIKYWVDRLISGVDDGSNVAYGFVYSREFQNKGVSDEEYVIILYHSFFGRDPFDPNNLDTDGYNYWVNKLKAGTDRMDVLAGFTNSVEFQNLCNKYNIKRGTLVPSEKPSYRKAHNLP